MFIFKVGRFLYKSCFVLFTYKLKFESRSRVAGQVTAESPKQAHTRQRRMAQTQLWGRTHGQVTAISPKQAHTWKERTVQAQFWKSIYNDFKTVNYDYFFIPHLRQIQRRSHVQR